MNLVSFSIRTKGVHNFARRLRTVFTRFGVSEAATRQALFTLVRTLNRYGAAPTFFIPAVVLHRHARLISEVAAKGAEIGVHGYVHNDYRTLSREQQYRQTEQAISIFDKTHTRYQGFRNPYLGWTEESLQVFATLGFRYESNEAVLHDVVDLGTFSPLLRSGFQKSLALFQAIPCSTYALRPHLEGELLRIPTSIPDDEMLFDRLRITQPAEVGRIWSMVMQRVYERGGLYTLNLHPERGVLCRSALEILLEYASRRPLPVWVARLGDIAQWWKERSQFRWNITPLETGQWGVEAVCNERATLLARHLEVEDAQVHRWHGSDSRVLTHVFKVRAQRRPCIGLSLRTPSHVIEFLREQGYAVTYCAAEEAASYALYLDLPAGLGTSRGEQLRQRSELVERIEEAEMPLLHFGCWPQGQRAALSISGDIDSVTVQDFFMRIIEVYQQA